LRNRALIFFCLLVSFFAWGQLAKKGVVHTMPAAQERAEARAAHYLESIRNDPSLVLVFLRAMPKGGDLHIHLSGSIFTENYIRWAADDGLCLNQQSFSFVLPPCDPEKGTVPAKQVLKDSGLYQQVINAQSMRFFNGPESGHDHFFNAFGKFGAVSRSHQGEMLAEVTSRAASQNVSYLEMLLAPDKGEAGRFPSANAIAFTDDFAALRQAMLDKGIGKVAVNGRSNLDQFETKMREGLKCGTPQADPGCDVTVRYQFEIHRGLPPDVVFAEMLVGFEMASADPRVVDVNPVMPEDSYVPMHDFELHMRMLDYLHSVYPNVHLSLHAGELWTGIVPPEGLRHHIRDSIQRGHANRIGHGVDVMFENEAPALLKEMAEKKIAVEINLSSNDMILGVRGNEHPFPMYLKAGVPVAISTDDEGVSRCDMTQEYWRAVRTYPVSYQQLKQIVRNSLEYSFLRGESLWSDESAGKKNPSCKSAGLKCEQFLKTNEKAQLQWKLEQAFTRFEAGECCTMAVSEKAHHAPTGKH
jgi:adenosine deaminase